MPAPQIKVAPKQSTSVYKVLSESTSRLTAQQIATELDIMPNTVYRAVKPLVDLGMVEELNTYPVSFRANSPADAMNWYLRFAAQNFQTNFGKKPAKQSGSLVPSITFIKDRKTLLAIGEREARKAKKSINYIVSGHRIPDSTVLAYRKAATIGVKIQCIVQNKPGTTTSDLEMYHEMGAEVRYLPNIGIRLFVFDSQTAIMTSYDETQSSRAFGILFTYSPVAQQLDQLFEQRWSEAEPLD